MILVLMISTFVLWGSYSLFKKAAGTMKFTQLSMISYVFYFDIILNTFIASILVVIGLADNHYMISITNDNVRVWGWILVLYSMITMPVGMLLMNRIYTINSAKSFLHYLNVDVVFEDKDIFYKSMVIFCLIFSFLIITYILFCLKSIPIITAIVYKNFSLAAVERAESKSLFDGIEYIRNLFGLYFIPIITYYIYILSETKKDKFYKILFFFSFILTTFLLLLDTQKAPILKFILGFVILRVLVFKSIKLRNVFIGLFILCGVVVFQYTQYTGRDVISLLSVDSPILNRIFIAQYGGMLLSLQWFPDIIKQSTAYIGLPAIISNLFDLPSVTSARLLMENFNPIGVGLGSAGVINSYYIGEAWANYGVIGVIFAPFIVGMVIQFLHIFLIIHKKTPELMAFYAYITMNLGVTGGFVGFLYLKQLIFPFFLLCFFLFVKFIVRNFLKL
ncbi:MAG: O-antigen polymerase [Candidatus Omnitrophota bacterium]